MIDSVGASGKVGAVQFLEFVVMEPIGLESQPHLEE